MFNFAIQSSAKTNALTNLQTPSFKHFVDQFVSYHLHSDQKDGRCVVPAKFTNSTRNDSEIESIQMLALDFDNSFEYGNLHMSFDEAIEIIETEVQCECVAYTSFSHSNNNHKFRILVSLDRAVTTAEQHQLAYYLYEYVFFSIAMLDRCVFKPSQPYYLPQTNNTGLARIQYVQGQPLDVNAALNESKQEYLEWLESEKAISAQNHTNKITDHAPDALINQPLHRRERLLRIICANYHKGASAEQAAKNIVDYDFAYHHAGNGVPQGPYFADTSKHNHYPGDELDNALTLVNREYRCLARKKKVEGTDTKPRRGIFGRKISK